MKTSSSRGDRDVARRRVRSLRFITLSIGVAAVLAGCTTTAAVPEGGQSRASALDDLDSTGFTDVELLLTDSQNGFQSTKSTDLFVGLPEGAVINDQAAVLDYLLRTAWSVSDVEPNSSITAGFKGALEDIDWVAVGNADGLPLSDRTSATNPTLSVDDATSTFGPWPGDMPVLPAGAITLP